MNIKKLIKEEVKKVLNEDFQQQINHIQIKDVELTNRIEGLYNELAPNQKDIFLEIVYDVNQNGYERGYDSKENEWW